MSLLIRNPKKDKLKFSDGKQAAWVRGWGKG